MLARGTGAQFRRQDRATDLLRVRLVELGDHRGAQMPSPNAIGTTRSLRHASTQLTSPPASRSAIAGPASSSATRSRFASGVEGSGGRPVEAFTQRSYGTAGSPCPGSPSPDPTSLRSRAARPIRYWPRSPPTFRGLRLAYLAIAAGRCRCARRYSSTAARSRLLPRDAAALAQHARRRDRCRRPAAARRKTTSRR